jgi:hypothetical protein
LAGQGGSAVLAGVLERVTFANPETGYTIAPERGTELITAVGPLLGAQIGELIASCLDELAAAEGVVREAVPAQAEAVPQVPAVYLPQYGTSDLVRQKRDLRPTPAA